MDAHKNLAFSAVATAPSPATSGTSLVVTAGHGTRFPAVPFNATIWPDGAIPTPANAEIVRVTARSTDTLTITRAQEGTSARTVVAGDAIAATITAKTLTDIEALEWDTVIRKPADETVSNSTTLQADDDFVIPVTASVVYYFEMLVVYLSSGTADFKHNFAVSTGAFGNAWRNHDGLGSTTAVAQTAVVADMTTNIVNAQGGTTPMVVRIVGAFQCTANANVTFQWAQNALDAVTPAKVLAGSVLKFKALA